MSNTLRGKLSSRRRGPNFSSQEKATLMAILRANADLKQAALSTKSDTASLHKKARAWTEIANRFKNSSREVTRTTDQLKVLWRNLVASARAKAKQATTVKRSGVRAGAELLADRIGPISESSVSALAPELFQDETLSSTYDHEPDNVLSNTFSSMDGAAAIDSEIRAILVKADPYEIFEDPWPSCTEQQMFSNRTPASVGMHGSTSHTPYSGLSNEAKCSGSPLHNNEVTPPATECGPEPESSVVMDMNMGSSEGYDDDPALAGFSGETEKPKSEAAAQRLYEMQQKFAEKEHKAKMLLMKTKYEYVALKKYRLEHELRLSSSIKETSFHQHLNSQWASTVGDKEQEDEEVID